MYTGQRRPECKRKISTLVPTSSSKRPICSTLSFNVSKRPSLGPRRPKVTCLVRMDRKHSKTKATDFQCLACRQPRALQGSRVGESDNEAARCFLVTAVSPTTSTCPRLAGMMSVSKAMVVLVVTVATKMPPVLDPSVLVQLDHRLLREMTRERPRYRQARGEVDTR